MRVLLDEDIDVKLRHYFSSDAQVETVQYRGWKGSRNGELLRLAERDFDVLVTFDAHIPAQQNLARYGLAVAILRPRTQKLRDCVSLLPELERRLPHLEPGEAVWIYPP